MSDYEVLVINPGSTSTKIAVYQGDLVLFQEEISHEKYELDKFETTMDQLDFRLKSILLCLKKENYHLKELSAVVARGGLLQPLESGTYEITPKIKQDLENEVGGSHASNLGGIIADYIAKKYNVSAYIVDPVVVDELQEIARYTGVPTIRRRSVFHALNQKAVGRIAAQHLGGAYESKKFVIAHLGGGISVAAHKNGRVIDVNNAVGGDGPFSPERAGTIPLWDFFSLSKRNKEIEVYKTIVGNAGLVSYLGTNDLRDVEKMISSGNERAKVIYQAMAYQIAKEIGSYATVLMGELDAIILTGGLAKSPKFINEISQYIKWIAEVIVIPGENEMMALNQGAQRILTRKEIVKHY